MKKVTYAKMASILNSMFHTGAYKDYWYDGGVILNLGRVNKETLKKILEVTKQYKTTSGLDFTICYTAV